MQKLDLFEHEVEYEKGNVYARARAFFVPPVAGAYTFLCSADDKMQLNGTLADGRELELCSLSAYSSWRQWDKYASQVRCTIALQASLWSDRCSAS